MKKTIILLIAFILVLGNVSLRAQNIQVHGVVSNTDGEPIAGATIVQKGTNNHVITSSDGRYSLLVPPSSPLQVTLIGYKAQEVKVAGPILNLVLEAENIAIDEVLVVAYRTTSKSSYTGSASVLQKSSIDKSQVSSVSRALQGFVPGVQSVAQSGQPGTNAAIYIRGVGSINAASTPLYVVDGAPFISDINTINPADIESLTVLKDAASSALYGSRGANGVIIITTKRGHKDQQAQINAKLTYGFSGRAVEGYSKVSTNDYFKLYWEALRNQELYINKTSPEQAAIIASSMVVKNLGINPYGSAYPEPVGLDGNIVQGASPLWDDNWDKAYEQSARRLESIVSVNGGGKYSDYYVSGGYLDDQGLAIGSGFKRYSGRINLNTNARSWLTLNTSVALTHSLQNYPTSQDSDQANALNFSRMMPNFYPVWQRNPDTGAFLLDPSGNRIIDYGSYRPSAANPKYNHLGSLPLDLNEIRRDVANVRTALNADIYKGLAFKTSFNLDYTNRNDRFYTNPTEGTGSEYGGSISKYNELTTGMTVNNIFSYEHVFGKLHDIKVLGGQEFYSFNTSNTTGERQGFVLPGLYEPDAAGQLVSFTGKADQYKLLSFLGNFEYAYNNKYFASASIRTDASSRFSPKTRWGTFWSLGASWRAINEPFLKNLSWLSNLSLRTSYGGQGNDNLGTYYAYKELFAIRNNLGESGLVTSRLPTPELKWETNLTFNLGLDFGLLNDRISGTLEFFNRRSKDLLFEYPKPLSTGHTGMSANVGALNNNGIEASIKLQVFSTSLLSWDVFANTTYFKNTITDLPQEQIIVGNKLLKRGGSIYDFFMVEWAGIDPADGLPQWYMTDSKGARVATKEYSKANTTESKIIAGSSLPDLVGGFGTNLRVGGFEFSALIAYSLGGKIYNGDKLSILHNGNLPGRGLSSDMLNRWTPENRNTDYPRLQTSTTNWTSASTRFLVDASFLRLRNITLGYNLPKGITSKVNAQQCKLFVQGENLLTLYKQQGMDPEQTIDGATYYRYPAMRTLALGLSLTF